MEFSFPPALCGFAKDANFQEKNFYVILQFLFFKIQGSCIHVESLHHSCVILGVEHIDF